MAPDTTAKLAQGGGVFADYESNVEVERAAVDLVRRHYEEHQWLVSSVEQKRVGYDLHCTQGMEEQHVEVKGIRGPELRFVVTAREVERSRADPQFRLATVTNVIDNPQMTIWTGEEFLRHFCLRALQYAAEPRSQAATG
jgi:hypothetical protein